MADFGLDFGTTNSVAAIVHGGQVRPLLDQENRPHPSVVWYHGAGCIVGREAKARIETPAAGVIGDIVRSPKSYVGTGERIHVAGRSLEPADVIAQILEHVRANALSRKLQGASFERAVVTIPVNMIGRGRQELRQAALQAGIRVDQFVHEPLAALYGFLRSQAEHERLFAELRDQVVLVFDWGGGTLDLTLCQFVRGALTQVQNLGNNRVGGDRFDERLTRWVAEQHAQLHGLTVWPGETEGAQAKVLEQCERAKIDLSERESTTLLVRNYLRVDGPARDLEVRITRADLEALTRDIVLEGLNTIDDLVASAGQQELGIAFCLATGGMVQMPFIREHLRERFGVNRLRLPLHAATIIAEGAAWIAHDQLRLTLAKPFELLDADNCYVPIIRAGTNLPREGEVQSFSMNVYCVDPRDGSAKLQFARPKQPTRVQAADPRQVYATLTTAVDPRARPLVERLNIEIAVDHNLIVGVKVRSTIREDRVSTEIHDLEFGLQVEKLPDDEQHRRPQEPMRIHGSTARPAADPGAVAIRSNVTRGSDRSDLIPGELVQWDPRSPIPERQEQEHLYYKKCYLCERTIYRIQTEGCAQAGCPEHERLRHSAV